MLCVFTCVHESTRKLRKHAPAAFNERGGGFGHKFLNQILPFIFDYVSGFSHFLGGHKSKTFRTIGVRAGGQGGSCLPKRLQSRKVGQMFNISRAKIGKSKSQKAPVCWSNKGSRAIFA